MISITRFEREALVYVRNTGGGATLDRFHEDHEPIGPKLWVRLLELGLVHDDGRVRLTDAGIAMLDGDQVG